ncbi:hypothetical protein [Longimicrobium sp.]|uniref:hypothetical protein n=1 Tax=Longimicrobium sp. TaxID=2029185 RepID=UPI002EDAF400
MDREPGPPAGGAVPLAAPAAPAAPGPAALPGVTPGPDSDADRQPLLPMYLPYLVGVLALAAYAAFVLALRQDVADGATEQEWLRLTYLFAGVESIAFAAAGFFFGREVNRGRAEQAEKRAASESRRAAAEEKRAEQAQDAARNGQELAASVRDAAAQADTPGALARDAGASPEAAVLLHLGRQAERLFPVR